MILRRIIENLKAQNWTAIGIELAIVILGVFIGTQVSNWNQERIERRESERLLGELQPALKNFAGYFKSAKPYYATSRAYADKAFAGWHGDPGVSDREFVIAAYQASQIYVFGVNGETWATIFGADRLNDIDDPRVRRGLADLMTFNYDQIDQAALATPYRQHVREVIPEDIQDAIRAECTDKPIDGSAVLQYLPATCELDIADGRFAAGAAALRARPDLAGELRWHRAAVASSLASLEVIDRQTQQLQKAIDRHAD